MSPADTSAHDHRRRPAALDNERRATSQRGGRRREVAEPLPKTKHQRGRGPIRRAWEAPELETLELASTEGGRKPSNKENGSKFVTS